LVTHKLGVLDLHNKLTLGLVLDTLLTGTLHFGVEFSGVYDLVDFVAADVTSIDSNLDAWFDITSFGDNTLDSDETANLLRLDLPHLGDLFL
jgi:hypothetical protein